VQPPFKKLSLRKPSPSPPAAAAARARQSRAMWILRALAYFFPHSILFFIQLTAKRESVRLLSLPACLSGGEFTKLKQSFKQRFETCVKKSRMK
jgi:hypothetical protein